MVQFFFTWTKKNTNTKWSVVEYEKDVSLFFEAVHRVKSRRVCVFWRHASFLGALPGEGGVGFCLRLFSCFSILLSVFHDASCLAGRRTPPTDERPDYRAARIITTVLS